MHYLDIERLWVRILLSANNFFVYKQLFNHKNLSDLSLKHFFNSLPLFSFEKKLYINILHIYKKDSGRQLYLNSRPKDQKVNDKTTRLRGFLETKGTISLSNDSIWPQKSR